MTIKNVTIGDKFKKRKQECKVVDILEQKSMVTGEVVGHVCIAKAITGLSTNRFEVPFATVVRNRV